MILLTYRYHNVFRFFSSYWWTVCIHFCSVSNAVTFLALTCACLWNKKYVMLCYVMLLYLFKPLIIWIALVIIMIKCTFWNDWPWLSPRKYISHTLSSSIYTNNVLWKWPEILWIYDNIRQFSLGRKNAKLQYPFHMQDNLLFWSKPKLMIQWLQVAKIKYECQQTF